MSAAAFSNIVDAGDVLVVGAGLAGLFTVLKLAPRQATILAASKRTKTAASNWAQGGIAAAMGQGDSPANHAQDTIAAGAGLVAPEIAHILANEASDRISDLCAFGVAFDRTKNGDFVLGREAAHSHNRIIGISGDRAGREIMRVLMAQAEAAPALHFLENFAAYELAVEEGRVVGVFARPAQATSLDAPLFIRARATILATGGCGHLFATTTNPRTANGEALAMAARAGAQIADAEFMQFHPTALAGKSDPAPLATEALRGEGAILLNKNGRRFMTDIHPDGELAPRDIVARAVFEEIKISGGVGLDVRRIALMQGGVAQELTRRFPTLAASCQKAGIDPTQSPIPIAPAAHFHMGGIRTDKTGRTNVAGLWACGEVAATGAHGANRLASNSLLEAIVFGARIAADINQQIAPANHVRVPQPPQTKFKNTGNAMDAQAFARLRSLMSARVGVVRGRRGLLLALHELKRLENAASKVAPHANFILAAQFMAAAALTREESRGAHYRQDFPDKLAQAQHHYLTLPQLNALYDALPPMPDEGEGDKPIPHEKLQNPQLTKFAR